MKPLTGLSRLSLNQITTQRWSVREAVDGCVRAGIPFIGLWRDKVAETGLRESARMVRDAGRASPASAGEAGLRLLPRPNAESISMIIAVPSTKLLNWAQRSWYWSAAPR